MTAQDGDPRERSLLVDEEGLSFRADDDTALDVLMEGRRVWSLSSNDHPAGPDGARRAEWPEPVRARLDGHATVELREHVSGEAIGSVETHFGSGEGRVSIVDKDGNPLAITKWGRLNRPFDSTDRATTEGYLDQVEEVLDTLREECGVHAFLSFGSLLGAVREGKLIGHDVDVDLGYLSTHSSPADTMRESFRIERVLRAKGWQVTRQNGGFLALFFRQADGTVRNMDVFTAFCTGDHLYQVHDVGTRADRSAVLPLQQIEFEGRRLPVPADPTVFLESAYGPGWRVPDPAFRFSTPKGTRRRINGWFGGLRSHRDYWRRFYSSQGERVPLEPSAFARWVGEQQPDGPVVDVGCGNGRDSLFFAGQGLDVTGLDLVPQVARRRSRALARLEEPPRFAQCNLDSLRETLAVGARLAHQARPRTVYGRFLLHALTEAAQENLWSLTSMALHDGGRCYLEFRTDRDERLHKAFGTHFRRFLAPDLVIAAAAAHGGRVVHQEAGRGLARFEDEDPHVCRLVLEWQ